MKKLIVIACALLALSVTASAQFMNSAAGKSSGKSYASSQEIEKSFGTFSLTYSPVNVKGKYDGKEIDMMEEFLGIDAINALSLTWTNAHNILASQPLYVEYGAGIQWAFGSDSYSDDGVDSKTSINFLSVKVPVSVVYDFTIPNTSFSIAPYTGLDLSGYILGQAKNTWEYDGEYSEYMDETSGSDKRSFFSKDDMDGEAFNRFILGWHIGARVGFGKYFLGVAYEGPITNFYNEDGLKYYSNQVNISLGFKF